jgi:hypothetical protein
MLHNANKHQHVPLESNARLQHLHLHVWSQQKSIPTSTNRVQKVQNVFMEVVINISWNWKSFHTSSIKTTQPGIEKVFKPHLLKWHDLSTLGILVHVHTNPSGIWRTFFDRHVWFYSVSHDGLEKICSSFLDRSRCFFDMHLTCDECKKSTLLVSNPKMTQH